MNTEPGTMYHWKKKRRPSDNTDKPKLTNRELGVLQLIARGMSNEEIGAALTIAEGTVKIHVHYILSKLGAKSRTGTVTVGLKSHLLSI
jgi:DNA-binding NarL/FixJ family response regulator